MSWEIGMNTYTLIHVKQITNENQLSAHGTLSALCNDLYGEENLKNHLDIYICITDSLYCTLETNQHIVSQIYSNFPKKIIYLYMLYFFLIKLSYIKT